MDYDTVLTAVVIHKEHGQHLHYRRQTPPFWSLPAFLLRYIRLCQLDSGVYVVAVWSFVFHSLWLGESAVCCELDP